MPQIFSRCRPARLPLSLVSLLFFYPLWPITVQAEVRVVTAQGEHRMGDRDTREDAVRLATEAAKRNALEQVATYLESVTVVEGLDITRDEIHTYTAGLVLVLDQQVNITLDNGTVVVQVNLEAQIDTEEVGQAIAALRENEDARHQLVALKQENEQLQQELDNANKALANASTAEETQQASQQRQEILNRVQSNAMVSQAWTDWVIISPVVYPYPWVGVAQANALLNVARKLYPNSPHVQLAQHEMVTRQPPLPLQAQTPTIQDQAQQPAARPMPLTLNEFSHMTPTAPPDIGNQPVTGQPVTVPTRPGSRTLTDVRQLNPLLPPQFQNGVPTNAPPVPPGSRSARALQQFLAPPSTGGGQAQMGQPPIARRLPPTISQTHPPTPPQIGNQPIVTVQPGTRGFTDVRQMNPLLPSQFQNGGPPSAQQSIPPGSRSARALRQFLAPPSTGGSQAQMGQPPINQIHPPMPQQAPRVPYQIAPRGFGGGGGKYGGGGRGGGGGSGGGGRGGGGRGR